MAVKAPPSTASLPHTWMYRSAVRSTLRFEVFLSSTLGMLRFRVSKHSFRWALLFFSNLLWTSLVPIPPGLFFCSLDLASSAGANFRVPSVGGGGCWGAS